MRACITCVCHSLYTSHPASRASSSPEQPLQMALNRGEVTKFIDAKKVKFLTFAGVKDGPGNHYKAFAYGYRPAIDIDVARQVTDSKKRAVIKLINESRRSKAALAAAKANGCQHGKGRPRLWEAKGGDDTVPPMSVSPIKSTAGKRLKPAAAFQRKRKSARKSLAASPHAESAVTILDNLAVKEPFTLVTSA